MPLFDFELLAIARTLEDDSVLVEALFFPEVSCYGTKLRRLHGTLKAHVRRIVESCEPLEVYRRHACGTPQGGTVTVVLEPPRRSVAWTKPVALRFHVLRWCQGERAHVGFVPALGIEVVARSAAELDRLLPGHIRFALARGRAAASLASLVRLQRTRALHVDALSFGARVASPREAALADAQAEPRKPVIEEVGRDLGRESLPPAYELDHLVARLADALAGRHARSVLLVGKSGVGKTAAVHELVRRRAALGLGGTPFWATTGSRLVAGMSGYGMWEERCQRLRSEASKAQAVLHLGSLVELMEVGKSEAAAQGIAAFFRPCLRRGELLAVAECTPDQLPAIEREDPHLLEAFHPIEVREPSPRAARAILVASAAALAKQGNASIEPDALDTLERLHRRYAAYSARPGRPLRFLRNLVRDRAEAARVTAADVTAAFSRETGLPHFMLDDAAPLDLGQVRGWFAERVIGQPEAAELVADVLAAAKARLSRPRRPIASLLFIGPTGVGKTEMAKALAELLFGSPSRLSRFDMSEYRDPSAVKRLIGGVFGTEGLLTAKVREQPFAVVLLDEFEKAHASFFDLLLQVLGEGRLTDAGGRVADFCNAVVVMTSNLGAEAYQQGRVGFRESPDERRDAREHFLGEVRAFLRPELFNRIDRIVPFDPLDEPTVRRIAERELELIRRRDGVARRGLELRIHHAVAPWLAREGYDPRYGARPLKRTVERRLLAPLAEGIGQYAPGLALAAEVRVDRDALRVEVQARVDEAGRVSRAPEAAGDAARLALGCSGLRRGLQRLDACTAMTDLRNDLFWLARRRKPRAARPWSGPAAERGLGRLPRLRAVAEALDALLPRAIRLEDEALLAVYRHAEPDAARLAAELAALEGECDTLLLSLYSLRFDDPGRVILAVYGEHPPALFELARAYHQAAVRWGYRVGVFRFAMGRPEGEAAPVVQRAPVRRPAAFLAAPHGGLLGIGFEIAGRWACPRLEGEAGRHMLKIGDHIHQCLVDTSPGPLSDYQPPEGIERMGAVADQPRRRTYNFHSRVAGDDRLSRSFRWRGRALEDVLAEAIGECLEQQLRDEVGA